MSRPQVVVAVGARVPAIVETYLSRLQSFRFTSGQRIALPDDVLLVLAKQLKDSQRRREYFRAVSRRPTSPTTADPQSPAFDPFRAAVWHRYQGNFDEACWLVFVGTHFAVHSTDGWGLARAVYGALGGAPWSWQRVSQAPFKFASWAQENESLIRDNPFGRRFGNHRKYESLRATGNRSLPVVVTSYVSWISDSPRSSHLSKFNAALGSGTSTDPFDTLYRSMDAVVSFGRLARFDYLTMLRDLGLFELHPRSLYLTQSTGPRDGARLLLTQGGATPGAKALERLTIELCAHLQTEPSVLEDALCNWQKSPSAYVYFGG